MDISTGQGAEEGGERGGAKAAVKVGDEAGLGKTAEGEECSVRGGMRNGDGGDGEKPQVGRGRLGKGGVEEADSKTETEVGVKTAKPLGRRRGDRPTRECERAKSGKKLQDIGEVLLGRMS